MPTCSNDWICWCCCWNISSGYQAVLCMWWGLQEEKRAVLGNSVSEYIRGCFLGLQGIWMHWWVITWPFSALAVMFFQWVCQCKMHQGIALRNDLLCLSVEIKTYNRSILPVKVWVLRLSSAIYPVVIQQMYLLSQMRKFCFQMLPWWS